MRKYWRSTVQTLAVLVVTLASILGAVPAQISAHATVDDFYYDSWHVDTHLTTGENGRAHARVTETLTPVFPEHDQNRGIVRALPLRYAGAAVAPESVSVLDASGAAVPFTIEDDDTFRVISIGDDTYVHGKQTYRISYELHDVIVPARSAMNASAPENSADQADEWYWDIIPLERAQAVESATARVTVDESLSQHLNGQQACYTGAAYATTQCELQHVQDAPDPLLDHTFVLDALPLASGAGVTLAIGFHPGSVTQPEVRLPDPFLDNGPIAVGIVAFLLGLGSYIGVRITQHRKAQSRNAIVAQYSVPNELPPLLAAELIGAQKVAVSAQIVHLAVAGAVRFEKPETVAQNATPAPKSAPVVRLVDPQAAVDALDSATITALFGSAPTGSLLTLPHHNEAFAEKISVLATSGGEAALKRNYVVKERIQTSLILSIGALSATAITVILLLMGSDREHVATWAWALPSIILAAVLSFTGCTRVSLLTPKGAEARSYLRGVKEFIRVAEADRIRVLQGFSTVERTHRDGIEVVHIYERLLPYAMLFGQERDWTAALESHYSSQTDYTPQWYYAAGLTGVMQLNRTLTDFTKEFTTAASYTSSSSSGAGGGGYSGGGGGGGFSGGR